MACLICNTCNKELKNDADQKLHYRSEWHCYNIKRQVAGVPGVTEALFLARQAAIEQERARAKQAPLLYCCGLCCKEYRSRNAYAQHLKSRSHTARASDGTSPQGEAIIRHRPRHISPPFPQNKQHPSSDDEEEEEEEGDEESEWEVAGSEELAASAAAAMAAELGGEDTRGDDDEVMDPTCCFMCDEEHGSVESCMGHMHRQHGLFIPDAEYLRDPVGFLTILALKVRRDFLCLYCSDDCCPFTTLEAVRNHMTARSHCKVHYGDGGSEEEADLEEFYDYSSSYVDENGRQLVVASGDGPHRVELGAGGSEIVIRRIVGGKVCLKTIGFREFVRFYRQRPRKNNVAAGLGGSTAVSRRNTGLVFVSNGAKRGQHRITVLRKMGRAREAAEELRTKAALKNNVIRNLPRNVPY